MPHRDWCGKPCYRCPNPCSLDWELYCSPDCEYLLPDGTINPRNLYCRVCDAFHAWLADARRL